MLNLSKDGLKEEVFSIIHSYRELMVFDKLRKIFYLHANLEGLYRLPFKAILKLKSFIPLPIKWWLIIETG